MPEEQITRRLAAIVAMDLAGYSRLMENDETGTLARMKAARSDVIEPELGVYRGRLVKTMGDGFLLEFQSAVAAVAFAVAVQEKFVQREADVAEDLRLRFRIGVNVGDVIIEGDDIFGDCVNVASRLEGEAEPGSVALSGNVQEQIDGKLDIEVAYIGERELKNISRPVVIWRYAPSADSEIMAFTSPAALALPDKPSIAVLPFTNMSGDEENEFFADGITEDIITELSRFSGFFVIARTTTFVYKGRSIDVKLVGRDLGVRYVLEGSVRRAGQRVRVNAQLIDATTNNHLWANRYDGQVGDIFDIQDRLTQDVVGSVAPELYAAEHARARRKPPHSLDAWECYVQALFLCAQLSELSSERSLELLERAVELDDDYAQPYGLKAWILVWRAFQGWIPMGEALRLANEAIAKGQSIDKEEQWALLGQVMVGYAVRDNALSLSSVERALQSNPNMAFAHGFLAITHAFGGRPEEALKTIDYAFRLSPREMFAEDLHLHYAFCHFAAGAYQDGLRHASISHRGRPYHPYPILMSMICAAHLDEKETAHRYCSLLVELTPMMNISMLEATCPYCLEEDIERFVEGLRKAGLPQS